MQRVSGQSPPEREKETARNLCERVATLYVISSIVIYIRSYSDSRLNSSISCDVLIAFAFPSSLPASFLSRLPALRPATSAKLRLEWDVARG
jgi:hypothetical protein